MFEFEFDRLKHNLKLKILNQAQVREKILTSIQELNQVKLEFRLSYINLNSNLNGVVFNLNFDTFTHPNYALVLATDKASQTYLLLQINN